MKTKHLFIGIFIYLINGLAGFAQGVDYEFSIKDSIDLKKRLEIRTILDSLYQSNSEIPDSLQYFSDRYKKQIQKNSSDSLVSKQKKEPKEPVITSKVDYNSEDSTIFSIDGQKVFLFGNAEINYEDIKLTAAYIEVDMQGGFIYAEGVKDSLGNETGQPIFVQGGEELKAQSITYNLKTEKGFIKGLYTQQDEGYLHSKQTKKDPDNNVSLNRGKYTTCDLEDPHFYLWISKGKVVPDKAIVASFSYLVIEDVPLYPLMIPFGYFPNTKEKASGFLIPKFGEETNRGFFLKQGGYYFAFSEYVDLAIQGDVYSKGSWQVGAKSNYKKRYKFGGNVNLNYSKVVANEASATIDGGVQRNQSNQYKVAWTHTQDPKARPNSNFSANVNFSSMGNNRYNSTNSQDYLTNTTSSSISYRKTFANTPFSMSMNLRHSQNTRDSSINLTLPQATLNMSRIFPFKRKEAVGKSKWYESLGITYTGNFQNQSSGLHDSVMFQNEMWDFFSNGIQHKIPLSTSIKVFKYFNLSPGINFTDRMYFKRDIRQYSNPDSTDYDIYTENGIYNVYDYSYSVGLSTKIYGMFQYNTNWLKAIRHVATPSVSLSYRPDFTEDRFGFYIKDTNETKGFYNPFEAYDMYGMPGTGKSGAVSFSLSNNVEMKVADNKDTTKTTKKIKLIEALNFSTSYNMIADSLNWSPVRITGRTTLFKNLSLNMNATADMYALDSAGRTRINTYQRDVNGKFFRLTNFTFSTGYSFKSTDYFNKGEDKGEEGEEEEHGHGHAHSHEYDYFEIPWDIRFDYSYNYTKTTREPKVTQTLSFSGNFSLTRKWKIGFRSGWDFEASDFSYTSFNLSRDLHCWMATVNIVPFGERQSYSFTIGVKSAILQDLKFDKNKTWMDQYAY